MTLIELPEGTPDRFQPPVSPAAEPFWEATRERRLVLQWCPACERAIHFPREACPTCLGADLELRPAAGTGTVYAVTTIPKAGNAGMRGARALPGGPGRPARGRAAAHQRARR
ncbi:hypothetical protein KSP35_08360 [Aquihabitans sp. G128]|uniref:Zn-ribbon domain-containing OB-fold protein n=1 Tax=Aquihabitans sp. G128 TaxID=2849779 RepID=UPI001C22E300|nr:zinc ribbon domain-containing protein [Aquihabitans sp. G128]QXC62779.1 hypothetical protein KSP35_08360 [Aquihabitans sp. G128]